MHLLSWCFDFFVNLDQHLNELATSLGPWVYGLLFLIIFCETGLVVTPVLPGDSLLLAAGALAASQGSSLSLPALLILLSVAAIAGDTVNYAVGAYLGPKVFKYEGSRFFNKKHLMKAHAFYEKYGGKTIIIARFIPFLRTFAPFVAGIGEMRYRQFFAYNVVGGIAWIALFLCGGYALRNVPGAQHNFHIIILAVIVISVIPAVLEFFLARRHREAAVDPVPVESK